MASGLLYGHQILQSSMLVLLPNFTLGSIYLLSDKKLISNAEGALRFSHVCPSICPSVDLIQW